MVLTKDIHQFIDQAFADGGPLSEVISGYRENAVQMDYAHAVADTFAKDRSEKGTRVGMLKAATGIGKTLGYLIPISWYAAQGHRCAVSTYTNHLLHQCLDVYPAVQHVTGHLLGRSPVAAKRIGLGNFVSVSRVEGFLEDAKTKTDQALIRRFLRRINDLGGVIQDYLDEYGSLPLGWNPSDICCLSADNDAEHGAYLNHLAVAEKADLVITNHTLAVLHLTNRASLGTCDAPLAFMVFDEADRLPDAAGLVISRRVSTAQQARMALSLMATTDDRRIIKKATRWMTAATRAEEVLSRYDDGKDIRVIKGQEQDVIEVADDLAKEAKGVLRSLKKSGLSSLLEDEWFQDLDHSISTLSGFSPKSSAYSVPALSFSRVRRIPSFQRIPLDPGQIIARYMKESPQSPGIPPRPALHAMVFTSATLYETESSIRRTSYDLGIFDMSRVVVRKQFEPARFGRMRFVLAGDTLPVPVESGSEGETSIAWVENTGAMIAAAARRGGRVLVLALSFRDTQMIAEWLRGNTGFHVIAHETGKALSDIISEYVSLDDAILISPAAWEGVDLPGMVKHLVITRLPYRPKDDPVLMVKEHHLRSIGYSEVKARTIVFQESRTAAVRLFAQGIGRGLRHPDDDVTVWIADPRFKRSGFAAIIPERFRKGDGISPSKLDQAEIFDPSQPAPEESTRESDDMALLDTPSW